MYTLSSLSPNNWSSVTSIMQNGVNSQNATMYLFSTVLSTCPNTFVTHMLSTGQLLLHFINKGQAWGVGNGFSSFGPTCAGYTALHYVISGGGTELTL